MLQILYILYFKEDSKVYVGVNHANTDSVCGGGGGGVQFVFFNDTATTEIYTLHIVGSVRCV